MNVLHLSTWKQRCGLADLTENVVAQLTSLGLHAEVFPLDVAALRYATRGECLDEMKRFTRMAARFDLVHLQHDFSLFAGCGGNLESIDNFAHVLTELKQAGHPVVVTFHTEPAFDHWYAVGAPTAGAASAGGMAVLLNRLKQKVSGWRNIARLDRQWRKRVACHFHGKQDSFRALILTSGLRIGLIDSGFAPESISIWPHGIVPHDPLRSGITREEAKARLGLSADCVLLSVFGFVSHYKGHLTAVQALKKLPGRYHLAIVGGPNLANPDMTLNSVLESWEREDPRRLLVTGYASRETVELYQAATDICLAPYLPEFTSGSGAICLALGSGRPTIASKIPAFSAIQREADCLLLCTPDAVHELAWHIQRLSDDAALQQKLVENALKLAVERNWNRVTLKLVDVYREMTGEAIDGRVPADPQQRSKSAA